MRSKKVEPLKRADISVDTRLKKELKSLNQRVRQAKKDFGEGSFIFSEIVANAKRAFPGMRWNEKTNNLVLGEKATAEIVRETNRYLKQGFRSMDIINKFLGNTYKDNVVNRELSKLGYKKGEISLDELEFKYYENKRYNELLSKLYSYASRDTENAVNSGVNLLAMADEFGKIKNSKDAEDFFKHVWGENSKPEELPDELADEWSQMSAKAFKYSTK